MATLYSNADATESSLVLIESQELGVAASSITFSAIPQTYKSLLFIGSAKTSYTLAHSRSIFFNANGDVTALNYRISVHWSGASHGAAELSDPRVCSIPSDLGAAPGWGSFTVRFPNYTDTTQDKVGEGVSAYRSGGGNTHEEFSWYWDDTSAITSFVLTLDAAASFRAGSRIDLYGIK